MECRELVTNNIGHNRNNLVTIANSVFEPIIQCWQYTLLTKRMIIMSFKQMYT